MNNLKLMKASLMVVVLSLLVLTTGYSSAATINVPADYATIQAAINAAGVGDEIIVATGTYNESVTINKNDLHITGNIDSRPSITGGLEFASGLSGLSFNNFILTGNAVSGQNSIILSRGVTTDLIIDNCVFDGENVSGRLGYSGGQLEGNISITNCEFKRILGWALLDSKSGSGGDGSAMGTITFAGNNIHDSNGSVVFRGLSTDPTDLVYIYNNSWDNIGGNNGETGEQWAAIEVNRAVEVYVYDNTVNDVALGEWGEGQAFQFWSITTLDVHNNSITNNAQGIFIYGDAGGTLGGPFAVPGGSVHCNIIVGNTEYGLKVDASATGGPLKAEKNWWGHASGPSGVGPGSGDAVTANVDYDPWLADDDIANCDNLIPVELNSFGAQFNDGAVTLTWSTATETENLGFHIHRSMAREANYVQVTNEMILGAGNSAEAHSYSYIDKGVKAGNTYYYKLQDVNFNGNAAFHGPISVTVEAVEPTNYELAQCYPNPFNPETAIRFSVKQAGKISLKIYNLQGEVIRTLVDGEKSAGSYSIMWNGTNDQGIRVTSGTYLYTLKVNGFEETKKLTVMK